MSIPLASLATVPLQPMRSDGPRARALLMDPATGVSLRLLFRFGQIDLLSFSPIATKHANSEALWPNADESAPGAVLSPNWTKIGDLACDASPRVFRDDPIETLTACFARAVDRAAGPSAIRRANALIHAVQVWARATKTVSASFSRHSIRITSQGAVLSQTFPETPNVPLPGAVAFARALAPLRTSASRTPVTPVVRLDLGRARLLTGHEALDLATHADALFEEAGMTPEDRLAYMR